MSGARRLSGGLLAALLALAAACAGSRALGGRSGPTLAGAVASEHPLATAVGLRVLEEGGNAADAAVAVALALAVVYPQAGNLGGGGFALWVPANGGESLALDFRETAPRALDASDFQVDGAFARELAREGPLSVGVPGSPRGLWDLHQRLGSLSFARLAEPAVRLARDGFEVDPWLAYHLRVPRLRERLTRSPAARRLFYPAGRPLQEGDRLVQPALADTLERLARQGPSGFYEGLVARAIAREMEVQGGVLDAADLSSYRSAWRTPLRGWFRGYEVVTMPPPSSGGIVLLQVLRVLDGFPLDSKRALALGERSPGTADAAGVDEQALHWWIEALRRAFADRAEHMGDPDFADVPVDELLAPDWIALRRTSIGEYADPDVGPWAAAPAEEGRETTHLSVIDRAGNAVSLTTTLNGLFGSGVMVGELGLLLNNEMDDFALAPDVPNEFGLLGGAANALRSHKRPLSSMTPAVLRQGGQDVALVLGSPGGPRIISAVLQVVLRVLVYGQALEEALAAPRVHQQWRPAATELEPGFAPELRAALERRGHELVPMPERASSVQAILVDSGGALTAASDPRRGGVAGAVGREPAPPAAPPEPEGADELRTRAWHAGAAPASPPPPRGVAARTR